MKENCKRRHSIYFSNGGYKNLVMIRQVEEKISTYYQIYHWKLMKNKSFFLCKTHCSLLFLHSSHNLLPEAYLLCTLMILSIEDALSLLCFVHVYIDSFAHIIFSSRITLVHAYLLKSFLICRI